MCAYINTNGILYFFQSSIREYTTAPHQKTKSVDVTDNIIKDMKDYCVTAALYVIAYVPV